MVNTNLDTSIGRVREAFTRLLPTSVPKTRDRGRAKRRGNPSITKVAVFTNGPVDNGLAK